MEHLNNDPLITDAVSQLLGGVIPEQDLNNQPLLTPEKTELNNTDQSSTTTETQENQAELPPDNTALDTNLDNDFFAKHFAGLDVADIEQAKTLLKEIPQLTAAYEQAKAEIEKLKATPHFSDENEKRAFEWVKQYRSLEPRAFNELKMLESIDPNTIDGKKAMEIEFILSKKHLSHEDARKQFEYNYNKRFTLDDMATDEDREMARIDKEEAEFQSKENLKNLKAKFGTVERQPETPEQKAIALALDRSLNNTLTEWDNDLSSTKDFSFKRGQVEVRVEVGDEEKKIVNQIVRPLLENKANYDSNGKLKLNVNYMVQREMKLLLFDKILEKYDTDATNKAKEEAMRSVTTRQPDILRNNNGNPPPTNNTAENMAGAILNHIK